MKLRTSLHGEGKDMCVGWNKRGDLHHDAAYAHALVRAMDWYKTEARYGHTADVAVALIDKRADELMAEWGYREE